MSKTRLETNDGSNCSAWKFEQDFALRLCEAVGTPRALEVANLIESDPAAVCKTDIDPLEYDDPRHFAEDYQMLSVLDKSVNIPGHTEEQRKEKAQAKFLAAEVHNAGTNDRLWGAKHPDWFGDFSAYVLKVLGPLDATELNEIAELGKFGPGVNVGVRGEGLVPSIKYMALPTVTEAMKAVLPAVLPSICVDYWGENLSKKTVVVPGNVHFTVPKNFEVERCAAKEPLWNSFLQSGIGRKMVKRLKRFGVDLHNQNLNQVLAEYAYAFKLATIDLSQASDLICRLLVVLALTYNGTELGRRWLHLLNMARSPSMRIDGETRVLEMFSSMGNGFTFPLETILFLAVVRTVVPVEETDLTAVYGDDIIVPQQYAEVVVERLEYLGFKVNLKKTCLAGTFFESCGTDWFKEHNVRPFYLHQNSSSPVPYPLQAANALRAWCLRVYGYLPKKYHPLWKWCKSSIPQAWRYPVPAHMGDVGLHVGLGDAISSGATLASKTKEFCGNEGHVTSFARMPGVNLDLHSFGVLACACESAGKSTYAVTRMVSLNRPCHHEDSETDGDFVMWRKWGSRPMFELMRDMKPQRVTVPTDQFSRGLEPMRGLFGKLRTEKSVVLWQDDHSWCEIS